MKIFWLLLGLSFWATPLLATPFTDNGNSTVTDQATGLIWDQQETSTMTWEAALAYCEGLSLASQTDWRLPNRNELQSLVDYTKTSAPTIDTTAFPSAVSGNYWSSTTYALNSTYAWLVSFGNGYVNFNSKPYNIYVRCVR